MQNGFSMFCTSTGRNFDTVGIDWAKGYRCSRHDPRVFLR